MVTLKSFVGDQLMVVRNQPTTVEEEKQTEKRTEFWLYFVSFFATILVLVGPLDKLSLEGITRVLVIVLGASLFWFLLGFKFYNRVKPTGSALSDVPIVICSAIRKRNIAYPQSSEQLHQNSSGDVQILPHNSWLRWLDRAAVVQENHEGCICCSVEQVKDVKYLLKMLPMWLTFITFSIVHASGDTFFLEEASSITDASFPLLFLISLQRFTELVVSETSDYVLEKLHEKMNFNAQRMMLVRIGIGMLCCVLCCITAWTQAVHRLGLVATHNKANGHMSVYRLTPQFLLLAFMEGLSLKGLQNFFESRVSRSMFRYGPSFEECVNAFGRFGSIGCILILSKWFQNGVEKSQLNNYYIFLAFLSGLNTIVYCLVALWYGDDTYVINYDLQMVIIGGEDQSESSPLLRRVRSFPPPSMTRGIYNRLSSMPH
ncbi:hypothetical protein C2S53_019426 [Perilla frutescens var. hirtella]|uniref:Uncharacterized protein n=1 Tax=Perilla frutescens var. hirtella TaxID=608512 RepID=A0AAD4PCK0_PERFH|nr:hypothetical protein C2S53_019426 [Perilla frutescens var. hirtella]